MKYLIFLLTLFLFTNGFGSEIDRLLNEYKQIKTVSCQMRRTVSGNAGKIQFVSRIYWTSDDRLHVDNLSPVSRRIISNGTDFFSYAEGDPRGFSRPVSDLSDEMMLSLRKIPGTAMDHLLRLKGAEETVLDPENGLRQIGCAAGDQYTVLKFDEKSRLVGIDYYKSAARQEKIGSCSYSKFSEVAPGVWVPMLHRATMVRPNDASFSETVRMDRFVANETLANSLFVPATFLSNDIDFVSSFEKVYEN